MNIPLLIISSLLMLVGLFGIVLPFVPGVPLVWLGLFIYAIGTGFDVISIPAVIIFFVLMALTLTLDFVGPMLGLKKYKASLWSLLGSFLGFVVGILTAGIWGVILGPIIGAFLAEIIVRKDIKEGAQAALGAFLGTILGNILKVVIALVMIGYFIVKLL